MTEPSAPPVTYKSPPDGLQVKDGGLPVSLPVTVWMLGLVSLLMDLSSEMIHGLLPVFLTATLGVSAQFVGIIEGVGEATASFAKVVAGPLSDRMGRRKPLILLGYGLAALSKPLFPLASGPWPVLAARFADRVGKGIRGAPRDAMIADVTPAEVRGRAYGLRQALDTVGAVLGPLCAIALMALFADNVRAVFWIATIPAGLAVLCILVGVREPDAPVVPETPRTWPGLAPLGAPFWSVTATGVLLSLARFSEAFLVLKAHAAGLAFAFSPLVLVAMNLIYALGAYPSGALADRLSPRLLLLVGLAALTGADIALALTQGLGGTFLGIALWGAHLALTQGLLSKLVAARVPAALRGTAFGVFNFATGAALLLASVAAGAAWDRFGPSAVFWTGTAFALLAAFAVAAIRSPRPA